MLVILWLINMLYSSSTTKRLVGSMLLVPVLHSLLQKSSVSDSLVMEFLSPTNSCLVFWMICGFTALRQCATKKGDRRGPGGYQQLPQ
jgi:hypothetical protein